MWWRIDILIFDVLCCVYMVYCAFTDTALWKVIIDVMMAVAFVRFSYDNIKDLTKNEQ